MSGMRWDLPEDVAHRLACLVKLGSRRCICADYAAVTATLHPDCPEHGHADMPRAERLARTALLNEDERARGAG